MSAGLVGAELLGAELVGAGTGLWAAYLMGSYIGQLGN